MMTDDSRQLMKPFFAMIAMCCGLQATIGHGDSFGTAEMFTMKTWTGWTDWKGGFIGGINDDNLCYNARTSFKKGISEHEVCNSTHSE